MTPRQASLVNKLNGLRNGTEALAVNNTLARRLLTLAAVRLTTLLRPRARDGACIFLSKHKVAKTGPFVHLQEAATMKFIAENAPDIPVPKVHCAFVHRGRAYIVMGPFETIHDFHACLRDGFKPDPDYQPDGEEDQYRWRDLQEMVAMQDGPWPPPMFTHGDLSWSNILVDGDEVTGIIDWEFAGWYPVYWEYTQAWTVNLLNDTWQGVLDQFLDPHPAALKMELARQRGWGEF